MPLRCEIRARRARILRRDAQVRLRPVVDAAVGALGDDHPAASDAEIERLVEIARFFVEHVAPDDAEVRRAVLDVGRHVASCAARARAARPHSCTSLRGRHASGGARSMPARAKTAAALLRGCAPSGSARIDRASSAIALDALDLRAEPRELLLDVLVAAIEVVDAQHLGLALGDEARDARARRWRADRSPSRSRP